MPALGERAVKPIQRIADDGNGYVRPTIISKYLRDLRLLGLH